MADLEYIELKAIISACRQSETNIFILKQKLKTKNYYHVKQLQIFSIALETEKEKFGKLSMTILKYFNIKNCIPATRKELKVLKLVK